ncbi:DUF4238 domain-containing protein [Marivirga lumbricoides]|uniref:DUF4238 domain-containing protein n=1 Tax=Marivirga lumbricoides TaxID=1046115 RepID=UPI0021D0F4A2
MFQYLKTFNLVIIEAPEDKQFLTSDNPVTFEPNQSEGKIGLFSNDTEVFLPLSKNYLAYFFNQNSEKLTSLRRLKNKGIYKAIDVFSEDEYELMVNEEIISKSDQLIIFPGKTDYRLDE